ncbi:hypothetical protein QL285_034376 [Trifolium repens]|nr:hypothetical protein QL285_034376 [Trifolium repens]
MLVGSFSDDQALFELIEDMIREVRSDVKPVLEFEAKHKLHSLEFDIFIPIPNIVRKKVTRSKSTSGSQLCLDKKAGCLEGTSKGAEERLKI